MVSGADPGTAPPVPERAPAGPLRRSLGFRDLVVYGLLFIAPMAPVGVFGTLDAKSHGAVALVYLAATVAMAFTAFSYAQMVRVAPQAGSVFTYARKGLGEGPGLIAGWMAMLDYLLIPAVAYLFSGIAMNALVPEVSRWVWTALAVVITTLLNLWGVRAAARVGFAVLALEILVLLVFLVAAVTVLVRGGGQRGWLSPLTGDGSLGFSTAAVLGAVSVAVLSYLGFDAIASFAEEVTGARSGWRGRCCSAWRWPGCCSSRRAIWRRCSRPSPRRSWRPIRGCRDPPSTTRWSPRSAPGCTTWWRSARRSERPSRRWRGRRRPGGWCSRWPEGRLPRALARTSDGTPRLALLVAAAITLVAAVWAARRDDGLDHLVSVVDVGALVAFTLLHASVVGWFVVKRREGPPVWWKHLVMPVLGAAVTVAVIVEASWTAQVVGAVWLAVGLGVLLAQRGRRAGPAGPGTPGTSRAPGGPVDSAAPGPDTRPGA